MKFVSPGKLKIGAKISPVDKKTQAEFLDKNWKKSLCLKSGNLADTKHLLYIGSLKTCTFLVLSTVV